MKNKFFLVLLSVFFLAEAGFALTGRDIMKKNHDLKKPDSSKSVISMKIYRRGGRFEEKEFISYGKKMGKSDKTLVEFIKPSTMKFLSHKEEGTETKQWIKRKSGGVKRIGSSDKGKQFAHSHFYYEDMSGYNLDDFDYKLLGDATALGFPCYKIEAVKKKGEKIYDKVIFYIRKSDFYSVKAEFYQEGKLHKYLEAHDLKVIDGIITAYKVIMQLADDKDQKTIIEIKSVNYNINIPSTKFKSAGL